MYELDLKTCTAGDVILRSLTCHPQAFRGAIDQARNAHREAKMTMINGESRQVAERLETKCAQLLQRVDDLLDGQLDATLVVSSDFDERIIAFTAAYQLQAIPAATAREIVGR